MKDDGAPQEDVTGLFRKFGGDAAAYKEFAPQEIPALVSPVAAPPAAVAPAKSATPRKAVSATVPARASEAPTLVPPSTDSLPTAAAPSALELLFARLDGRPAVPVPVAARGLMAHWRKPT
jgi:hypothetical protein